MEAAAASFPGQPGTKKAAASSEAAALKYVDNNDTVSNGFIWFHLKMKPWHGK